MKKKIFTIALVLSAIPYHALFIAPAVATLGVASQYDFFSSFSLYFLATLCVIGYVFPVIPLSVAFHAGIIMNLILKKLKVPENAVKILPVITSIIIFILLTVLFVAYFRQIVWEL